MGIPLKLFALVLLAVAAATAGIASPSQLTRDLRAGRITRLQSLEYELFAHFDRGKLPERYRQIPLPQVSPHGLTPLMFAIQRNLYKLSDSAQALYEKIGQIPLNAKLHTSPKGHFLIHYYDTGDSAVPAGDEDADGVPDYVEMTAALFDSAWTVEVEQLGYTRPQIYSPPGSATADAGKYHVFLANLESLYYGFTYPAGQGSYIQIRNDYDDFQVFDWKGDSINDYRANPAGGVGVTAAHELFHAIQMNYLREIDDPSYFSWVEGTAVYMEETVFPDVNDYLQYAQDFFWFPDSSLFYPGSPNDLHGYAVGIWPMFLARLHGHAAVRRIWEAVPRFPGALYPAMAQGLSGLGTSLTAAYGELARACFYTDFRANATDFPDPGNYPPVKISDTLTVRRALEEVAGGISPLAFKYTRVLADDVPQRTIEFTGYGETTHSSGANWAALAIALDSAGRDTVYYFALNSQGIGRIRIDGWDRYDSIMLVAVNASENVRQQFKFAIAASEYDTVQMASGQTRTFSHLDGQIEVGLTAAAPISGILEFSYTTTGPAGSQPIGLGHYYDLHFTPDAGRALASVSLTLHYDAAFESDLAGRNLRLEELGCFLWDSASSTWQFQSEAQVDRPNGRLIFTLPQTGLVGLFRNPTIVQKFAAYPSPADFGKISRVFFPLQNGGTLSIFTLDGLLVRKLRSSNPIEYDLNRFVWDGRNRQGAKVKAGLYYAVGSNSTGTQTAKMIVSR